MNAFDYFFENTSQLDKSFLVGKEEISYPDLYKDSINLAGWIKSKVGENKHILLLSANNLFFIKVYLAIIKSGNICIPLDPSIEHENYRYIDELTRPALIFITREVDKKLNLHSARSVFPDKLRELETWNLEHEPRRSRARQRQTWNMEPRIIESPFDRERCAEIIFTSGSTGKPKGVMISHKNLIANTGSIVEYLKLTRDDRMLVVLPFYYCYGLSLLHTHLRAGGSIVFNNSFIFLGRIIKDLLEYKCTGFAGVPSHFQILLRKSDSFKKTSFPDLKYVTQAGGKLAPIFIDEFRGSHPGIKFIVMYGQTEATARLSWLPPELYEKKKGSMGKGIPGVDLMVINEKGERIKPGETGEVVARGDNIMMGYLADDEGTKNAIRNGWLYTGDLGTVDGEGYIYLTARKKEIIKVGGKRISPKEVEAVILELPEVIDCTIEGTEDDILGEAIKATIVVNSDKDKEKIKEMIREHCSKYLALYKVPGFYEISDQLIISSSGKKVKKTP
jgi:long-chain acyl-CoA synthetase